MAQHLGFGGVLKAETGLLGGLDAVLLDPLLFVPLANVLVQHLHFLPTLLLAETLVPFLLLRFLGHLAPGPSLAEHSAAFRVTLAQLHLFMF